MRLTGLMMALLFAACHAGPGVSSDAGVDVDVTEAGQACAELGRTDSDGDGLADLVEGNGDTDGDGTEDFLDLDSDGDGRPDVEESGVTDCESSPLDSDGDGTPDFQDTDSDDNGIEDSAETDGDIDDDGRPDWCDVDDDGDGIDDAVELGADPSDPPDVDQDGVADYHDEDSDGDGVPDLVEGSSDEDGDGLHNFRDTDADGDGIQDADEGVTDCDDDGFPNFLDEDSDGDGLTDADEVNIGTDPCNMDTDGDELTDLVERTIGTDPVDDASGIGPDEYMVILPYMDPPRTEELVFETDVKQADVYFLIDTTGSMYTELDQIRESLTSYIVPEVSSVVDDVQFGLGRFDDAPVGGYGSSSDVAYLNIHDISGDTESVQEAIDTAETGSGSDGPESDVIALYCAATGEGVDWASVPPSADCLEGRFGYPCFRPYSLPIILLFTDYSFHNGPPDGVSEPYAEPEPSFLSAVAALNEIGAKVLGFSSEGSYSSGAHEDLVATAIATGAVTHDGEPLVWDLDDDGAGLDEAVVSQIADLTMQVSRDVTTYAEESPRVDDGVEATDFIRSIVPVSADPETGVTSRDDSTFFEVQAGTFLTFEITFANEIVPCEAEPQVFVARIVVVGDDTVRLDERRVIILVPQGRI